MYGFAVADVQPALSRRKQQVGRQLKLTITDIACSRSRVLAATLVALLWSFSAQLQAVDQEVSIDKLISAYIFKFTDYIRWQDEDSFDELLVGVHNQPQLYRELKRNIDGKTVRGKTLRILPAPDLEKAGNFHILYLPANTQETLESVARSTQRTNTLLLTMNSADKQHVMINFKFNDDNTLTFEINRANIVYEGISLSKEIVLLGGTELDVAEIYKETEQSLQASKKELAKNKQALENTLQELKHREALIKEQNAYIKLQETSIQEKEDHLKKIATEIDNFSSMLTNSEQVLAHTKEELDEKKTQLRRREIDYAKLSSDIENNYAILTQQQQQIQQQEREIDAKQAKIKASEITLEEQSAIIRNQQYVLYFSGAFLLLFLVTLVVIYKNYKLKRESNDLLEDKNRELKALSEAKSQFLSTMSHEIRTPLSGVLGMANLLKDTHLTGQQLRYVETIDHSGEALLSVINDILDYSKIEANKMELEDIEYSLEELIDDCTSIFALKAAAKNLAFNADVSPGTPLMQKGDPTRIRQIILNLLGNAFKFTEYGGIRLNASLDNSSRQLRITIRDTGIGIAPELQDKLFHAFTQADSSTTRKYGGTGLGLSICRQLVNLMGGEIGFSNNKGAGTTFWFTLPCVAYSSSDADPNKNRFKGYRILISDSDRQFCHMVATHTRYLGMETQTAYDADDTLSLALEAQENGKPFDIYLISHQFHNADGFVLTKELSASLDENSQGIKFITSNSQIAGDEYQLSQHGVNQILQKPFSIALFRNVLALTLEQQQEPESSRLRKLKDYSHVNILVVEDNHVNQLVIKGLLSRLNIDPVVVDNGMEAANEVESRYQQSAAKPPFDLILMDCEMPEMDGFEATLEIRALEERYRQAKSRRMQIIALTAHVMTEHKEKALRCGMNSFLAKPINQEELEQSIERVIVDPVSSASIHVLR